MSETPRARIEADLHAAMKQRDKQRTGTMRLLLSMLENRRIELGDEVGEAEFLSLVRKAVKQRREAAEQFRAGDREERAVAEEAEAALLEEYLPEPVDEGEIRAAVEQFVAAEGLHGPRAMGQVMKAMLDRFEGRVDGKQLSGIVRDALG